jgi:hypothetical protein
MDLVWDLVVVIHMLLQFYDNFYLSGFWGPEISFKLEEKIKSETQADGVNVLPWEVINQSGVQPIKITIGQSYGFDLIYRLLNYFFFVGLAWENLKMEGDGTLDLDIQIKIPILGDLKIKDVGSASTNINGSLSQTSLRVGGGLLYPIKDNILFSFSAAVSVPLTREEEWKIKTILTGPLKSLKELGNEDINPATQDQMSEKEEKSTDDLKEGSSFIRSIHPVASVGIRYLF